MELEQIKDLLTIIKLNYPQSFNDYTKKQSEAYLNLWAEAFKDDNANLVVSAVKSIIYNDIREFAPNIGQVKNKMYELTNQDLTEQEAWSLVKKACGNSLYNSYDEFNKLPPTIQKLVGSPNQLRDWAMMDRDELNTVVSSNFQRSYKTKSKQVKEFEMLPNEVKGMIGTVLDRKLIK